MVRFNLLEPAILTDEHLYAERVELLMLSRFVLEHPKGFIPDTYRMGKGHMSFFRNKPNTIRHRTREVTKEISKRTGAFYWISAMYIIPEWNPHKTDIEINKERIIERLRNPLKKKNPWHYYGEPITDIEQFIKQNYEVE